jgi:hypothetical protein
VFHMPLNLGGFPCATREGAGAQRMHSKDASSVDRLSFARKPSPPRNWPIRTLSETCVCGPFAQIALHTEFFTGM